MSNSRRDFLKKSAALAALTASGGFGLQASGRITPKKILRKEEYEWMDLCLAHFFGFDEIRMQLSTQMGAYGAVTSERDNLKETYDRFKEAGLEWKVLEGVNLSRAQLGVDGRDEDIEKLIRLIKGCSELGIKVLCYNWMPVISWARTDSARKNRGGSLVTAFDYEDIEDNSLTEYGEFTEEQLWENMQYFLDAVIPVAEEYDVKLALHPDDPPVDKIRGIPRIFTNVDAFKRLITMNSSDYNGICFCQGSFASQKDTNIPEAIRYFGSRNKIHFVHFRDVTGHTTNFSEEWHDNGKTDMYEAMKAYYEVGFRGPLRPDHVPTVAGDSNEHPGYSTMGTLFAIGYIKGLMEAVAKEYGYR
ncbi:mannonate dehydratase [Gracilimonas mengyeensis]|uniref:mannonate dehydratase n=1 Tax=Gracilimonas mengyeensis TaxID=1302730 RepID=A0A521DHP6_9BACT|nr:mannonate dehydratase [Gracilimonas mengyeensis]SMO70450.1 mannonate dehydratase [Gracilimonas mengyeensis]